MVIKDNWALCQEGLYAELHTFTVNGLMRGRYNIYSAEGYCFYSLTDDEEFPVYNTMAFTPCTSIEEINKTFKSIPISEQKTQKEEKSSD